jgi:hypothetical protein
MEVTKRCTNADCTEKPASEFYSNKARPDGLSDYCAECTRQIRKKYRERKKREKEGNNDIIDVEGEVVDSQTGLLPYHTIDAQKRELATKREIQALEARMKDLTYVYQLDQVTSTFLDKLTEDDKLEMFLNRILEKGTGKDLQHVMIALGVTLDKREKMLSYDSERADSQKRKTRLKVMFQGSDGTQAGVSVETEE